MKATRQLWNMINKENEKWSDTNNDVLKKIKDVNNALSFLLKAQTSRQFTLQKQKMANAGYKFDEYLVTSCFCIRLDDKDQIHLKRSTPSYIFKILCKKENDSKICRAQGLFEEIFQ